MRLLALLSLVAWASCAAGMEVPGGAPRATWPSLAKRSVETAAPGVKPGKTVEIATGIGTDDGVTARLATAARDIGQLEQRWATQLKTTQRAQAALQGHPGGEADATAQLETGRLDKLAGQVAHERAQIEVITGELAMAAATGSDVGVPLRTAGLLLVRCAKLTALDNATGRGRSNGETSGPQ